VDLERMARFACSPSVERRIAQQSRFKKDRFGQQPVNSGQKRRSNNFDNFGWRMGRRKPQAGQAKGLFRRSRFDIDPGSPVFMRRAPGPAPKRVPKGGCVTEPQRVCDIFDRKIGIANVFYRRMRP
jgi:hypothetical protein